MSVASATGARTFGGGAIRAIKPVALPPFETLPGGCAAAAQLVYSADASDPADVPERVLGGELAGTPPGATTWEEAMSRVQQHQHPNRLVLARWIGAAVAVVAALLLVLFVRAATRPTPVAATRAPAVGEPARANAASGPALSEACRAALATANRMTAHGDAAVADLRAHKKLMDDYKSGKIDRAKAFPQGSPWRQALARTLKEGAAAADQYDADKATYRDQAAVCSKGG